MKHKLPKLLIIVLVLAQLPTLVKAQWTPFQYEVYKLAWRTAPLTSIKLKASGYDYVTVTIQRDANNKTESSSAVFNPLFSKQEFRSTSVKSGNLIIHTTEKKDPDNGLANFTTTQIDSFYTDGNNVDTMIMEHHFDETTGQKTSTLKTRIDYNGTEVVKLTRLNRNSASNTFELSQIAEFKFNGGLIDSVKSIENQSGTFRVGGVSKYYHNAGKLDSIIDYDYDFNLNTLVREQKMVTTVDANNFTTQCDQYDWDVDNNQYEPMSASWIFNSGSSNPTGISEKISHSTQIFPNPSNGIISINGITEPTLISVFNINGQVMEMKMVNPNENLDFSGLPKGVYFLQIGISVEKLIIE